MAIFPGAIAADSDLYVAVNQKNTTLTSGINNSTLTIPVVSTTGFPSSGFITIDSEIIHYTSVGAAQFNADLRGADSTSAASHSNGAFVYHNIVSAHHNALKDEIKATEQFISDLIGRTNTQVKAPDGTVSLPSLSFASSNATGFYRAAANTLGIVTNGAERWRFSAAGDFVPIDSTRVLYVNDGSLSAPGIAFNNQAGVGIYRAGSNNMQFVAGGTSYLQMSGSILQPLVQTGNIDGNVSSPSYSFLSDSNTGFFRGATGRIDIAGSGVTTGFFKPISITDGTQNTPLQLRGGGGGNGGLTSFENRTQTAVSTSATTIYNSSFGDGNMVIVFGKNGSAQFTDIIASTFSTTNPAVVVSHSTGGAVARTYTQGTSGVVQLAMASGSYDIHAFGIAVTTR